MWPAYRRIRDEASQFTRKYSIILNIGREFFHRFQQLSGRVITTGGYRRIEIHLHRLHHL
jgi:hypothetical protein